MLAVQRQTQFYIVYSLHVIRIVDDIITTSIKLNLPTCYSALRVKRRNFSTHLEPEVSGRLLNAPTKIAYTTRLLYTQLIQLNKLIAV